LFIRDRVNAAKGLLGARIAAVRIAIRDRRTKKTIEPVTRA
jgi:hypothetical protein